VPGSAAGGGVILSLGASAGLSLSAGLPWAKKRTLIAIAKPLCNTMSIMSRSLLVLTSVADRTGYKLRTRNVAETARPAATKM
jgi:hypothetical protein